MDNLKRAIIFPLIKDLQSLVNKEEFKNYRPVSQLVFLSKLIERVVDKRLEDHLTRNNLHASHQFAYKKGHSPEMLHLKMINKLLKQGERNLASVLLFLDLSAAFNTVDHKNLLRILRYDYGIVGNALKWFESFLIGRSFKIKIGDSYSTELQLIYGVAQGSVLGPRLFNLYCSSLHSCVQQTKFDVEGFADDHQLVKHFYPDFQHQVLSTDIQECMKTIMTWMNSHFLRINPDKTKIIVIAPPFLRRQVIVGGTFLGNECIRFVETAKNLGVVYDQQLNFDAQVTKVAKSCFQMIRNLYSIRHFINSTQLKQLVCSKILSKIDYCNILYFGINESSLRKLQHVQNCAARLIIKKENPMSLDNFFYRQHWLKVKERIHYKVLLIVHKCITLQAPPIVGSLLNFGNSIRTMKLEEQRVYTRFGTRSFEHIGPKLWNLLSKEIRNEQDTIVFKKRLKSYLILNGNALMERYKIS